MVKSYAGLHCNDAEVRIKSLTITFLYLTGDLNTWNDAKRAEERERVKHSTDNYQDFFTYSGRTIPYEK